MSLPIGYTPLEYIESSGTQYIDTSVIPTNNTKIEVKGAGSFYASINGTYRYGLYLVGPNNRIDIAFGSTGYKSSVITAVEFPAVVTMENGVVTANGNTATFATQSAFTCSGTLPLFVEGSVGTLYYCKIYDNGALVRDFIPCQTSFGEVGLWDNVNGEFYGNAGTGAFIAGPVAEYAKLEYIESTGSQYVDTGFKPGSTTRLVADMEVLTGTTSFLFGSRHNSSANASSYSFSMPQISGTSLRSDYGSTEKTISVNPVQRLNIDMDKNRTEVNGIVVTTTAQTFRSSYNLCLFAVNTAGTIFATKTTARLYSCQIYDNGTLVRDYIPVRRVDGTVGLLDQVNFVFCPDAAGVGFVAGPVIPDVPGNFRQTCQGYFEIGLAWDASEGAAGYNLYKDGALIYTGTDLSYLDTQGYPSTSYIYQVTAFSAEGEGDPATLEASTKAGWAVIEPVFLAASISPNPVDINQSILISVQLTDAVRILDAEIFYSGELYAGEV